jgi:hypothetical protein
MKILMMITSLVIFLLGSSSSVEAQLNYRKVLLPIDLHQRIPGDRGSLWDTRLWVLNDAGIPVEMRNWIRSCVIPECPPNGPVPPSVSFQTKHSAIGPDGIPGAFLLIDERFVSLFAFRLNVFDTTRTAEADGTELPVVAENGFRQSLNLLDVPARGANLRHTIRVYSLDGSLPGMIRIRVFRIKPSLPTGTARVDEQLGEAVIPIQLPSQGTEDVFPGYIQLDDLRTIAPAVLESDRLRVRIDSMTPDIRIWAFASVTSNTTSVVTTITPVD